MLWLLASEDDGNLPDIKTISFRLRMPESEVNACISRLSHYLEQDASTVISSVYQPDTLEKRREETEKKPVSLEIPDWIDVNDWKDFVEMRKKIGKPMTDRASKLIISKLEKMKVKGISPSVSLQNSILNAWQDVYEPKVHTQQNSMGRRVL
jgi:BRCT domain type II-containing protein